MAKLEINKQHKIEVRTGDIVFRRNDFYLQKPGSWLPSIIRWFTGAKYNHVDIVVENWGYPFVNGARGNGITPRPIDTEIINRRYIILRPRFKDGSYAEEEYIARRANFALGKGYDFKALFIYYPIYILTGRWVGKRGVSRNFKQMVCTEYVAWIYSHLVHSMVKWWTIDPSHILDDDTLSHEVIYEGYIESIDVKKEWRVEV